MAETLGSLVDKLSIKCIREHYLNKSLTQKKTKFSKADLKKKLVILKKQKSLLSREIDQFVYQACAGKITLRDDKLKIYNNPEDIGRIGKIDTIGQAINGLAAKNLELWQLEDEARRQDVDLSYIGGIKHKIDKANQQRNDFIDKIDELLEKLANSD